MSNYAITFDGHGTFTPEGSTAGIADVAAHNAEVEREELAAWAERPERWQVYVHGSDGRSPDTLATWPAMKVLRCPVLVGDKVTTWLGTPLGTITYASTYRNNFGSRTTAIRFRGTNGAEYYGRYGADWSQLCRVRKVKGVGK